MPKNRMNSTMKQSQARRFLRFCLPAALLLLSTGAAHAQARSSALQAADPDSFLFMDLQERLLFPETGYRTNPAILAQLSWDPLITDLDASYARQGSTAQRLDETKGALGGTDSRLEQLLDADLFLEKVFHFGKGNTDALAWSLSGSFTWNDSEEMLTDYNAFTENILKTTVDMPFSAGTDLIWGSRQGFGFLPFPFGASLGYSFSLDRALFTMTSDALLSVPYASGALQDNDVYTHSLRAALGAILPISKVAELSAAVRYEGSLVDGSAKYVAMDSNLDGYAESIVTTNVYHFALPGGGGPAVTATKYENRDLAVSNTVLVDPTLRLFITDGSELFVTGSYKALGLSFNEVYERIRLSTDIADDLSRAVYTRDSSLTSFQALAGIAFKDAGGVLKAGLGYAQDEVRFRQEGCDSSGQVSLFSSLNPDNYTELELGTDPINESIVISDGTVAPASEVTRSLFATSGWTYKPAKGVGLFLQARVAGTLHEKVYKAYNLDTRSVWTETVVSSSIDWSIAPSAGFYLPLGPKGTFVLNLSGADNRGSVSQRSETAPTSSSYTSGEGSIDLAGGDDAAVSVSARILFRF